MTLPIPDSNGATFRNNINTEFSTVESEVSSVLSTAESYTSTAISSATSNLVEGINVSAIWTGTSAAYAALGTCSNTTLYFVHG